MAVNGDVSVDDGLRSDTIDTSFSDDRRGSFGSNHSASESLSRRLSHGRDSSRSESVSEEENQEQKSAANLKAVWENRATPENAKSLNRPRAIGGQTGASSLKERFENPSSQQRRPSSGKVGRQGSIYDADGEGTKKVSTSALRARFEQKAAETTPPKRNFVINRGKMGEAAKKFNQGPVNSTKCMVCSKTVYPMEKIEIEGKPYHKLCFKCETCKRTVALGNYAALEGKFYCKPHLKQLFQLKGNYDEGFGRDQRKADWINKDTSKVVSSTPEESIMQSQRVAGSNDVPPKKDELAEESPSYQPKVNGHFNGYHMDEQQSEEKTDKKLIQNGVEGDSYLNETEDAVASDDDAQYGDDSEDEETGEDD